MTPADKLAEVVEWWRERARVLSKDRTQEVWQIEIDAFCDELQPILAELQRAQGRLTPLIEASRDLLEVIYQLDARGDLPSEISGELMDRVFQGLLSAPTPAESQEIVNVGGRKFTRIPNIVGDLQEIVSDGSTPEETDEDG